MGGVIMGWVGLLWGNYGMSGVIGGVLWDGWGYCGGIIGLGELLDKVLQAKIYGVGLWGAWLWDLGPQGYEDVGLWGYWAVGLWG